MSYFLAVKTLNGLKPVNRWPYPTYDEARTAALGRNVVIVDAEHEPGCSLIKRAGP